MCDQSTPLRCRVSEIIMGFCRYRSSGSLPQVDRFGEQARLRNMFWVLLIVFSAAIAAATWHSVPVLSPDGTDYIHSGVSLLSGHGFTGIEGKPQLHYSPGFPIAIGLVNKVVADPVLAGRLISLVSSIASVLLIASIGSRLFGKYTGATTALIFSVMPIRITLSHQVLSESLFLFLMLVALLLWLREAESHKFLRAALIGAVLGYSYLTRPEGLVAAVVLLGFSIFGQRFWTMPNRRSVAVAAITLVLVAIPYVAYLHVHTGRWALNNKQAVRSACIAHSHGLSSADIFRLSPDNTRIDWTRFTETPRQLAHRYAINLHREAHEVVTQLGMILKLCLLLGIAFELYRSNKVLWNALPVLAVLSLPLVYLPAFYPLSRYVFLGIIPVLMLACWQLTKRFSPTWAESSKNPLARATVWIPVLIVLAYTLMGTKSMFFIRADTSESPRLAAWVRGLVPTNEALITSNPTIPFYTGNRFVRLPYDSVDRVLIYAKHQHAEFLLILPEDLTNCYDKTNHLSRAESEGKLKRIATLSLAGKPRATLLYTRPDK